MGRLSKAEEKNYVYSVTDPMGDSVQPRKYIALGMFPVTFSIFASKRASIHLPKIFLCNTSSVIVKVAFTKCHSPG